MAVTIKESLTGFTYSLDVVIDHAKGFTANNIIKILSKSTGVSFKDVILFKNGTRAQGTSALNCHQFTCVFANAMFDAKYKGRRESKMYVEDYAGDGLIMCGFVGAFSKVLPRKITIELTALTDVVYTGIRHTRSSVTSSP